MNAKDMLQFNEQLIAFDALMKGKFAKELAETQAALDELGTAEERANAQAKIVADSAALDSYIVDVNKSFDRIRTKLEKDHAKLAVDQQTVMDANTQVEQDRASVMAAKLTFESFMKEERQALALEKAALAPALAALVSEQAQLVKDQTAVAQREAAVQAKLDAISAAAKG